MEDCEAGILILHRNQEKKMNTDYSIKLLSDKARSLHGTAIQSVLRHADINKLKERIHIFQNMDIQSLSDKELEANIDEVLSVKLDGGITISTIFSEYSLFGIHEKEKVKLDIAKLEKAFAPVGNDRVKMIEKLKPEYAAIFPSFNQGQEMKEKSSVPEPVSEKTVGKVLALEKMKERYQSPEYIPVTFDMETQMVAESPNLYIANLPKEPQESKDFIRCISLDKAEVSISEDGKRLQAYLKRSGTSEVREIDLEGKELRKYSKKNEDIAAECLKYQRSRGKERQPVPEEILRHKLDVNLKKR